jgi:hypothetical protein
MSSKTTAGVNGMRYNGVHAAAERMSLPLGFRIDTRGEQANVSKEDKN